MGTANTERIIRAGITPLVGSDVGLGPSILTNIGLALISVSLLVVIFEVCSNFELFVEPGRTVSMGTVESVADFGIAVVNLLLS